VIPRISLRKALADPQLLGGTLQGESWQPWRGLLIASMGEELSNGERENFRKLTGRERESGQRVEELVCVVGRRGGKSRAMATIACYVAGLCEHDLAPGERGSRCSLLLTSDKRRSLWIMQQRCSKVRQFCASWLPIGRRTSLNSRAAFRSRCAPRHSGDCGDRPMLRCSRTRQRFGPRHRDRQGQKTYQLAPTASDVICTQT
jgi:hypothetical protein